MLTRMIVIFIFTLILIGCSSEKEQQKEAAATDSSAQTVNEGFVQEPEWYQNVPQVEDSLYAVGMGSSMRPKIALQKAMMKAQVELARQVQEQNKTLADQERVDNVKISGYRVVKQEQVKDGRGWRVYVLLNMPAQQ